jgi:hypothetical protein
MFMGFLGGAEHATRAHPSYSAHLYRIRVQVNVPKHAQRRHPRPLPPPLIDRVHYQGR